MLTKKIFWSLLCMQVLAVNESSCAQERTMKDIRWKKVATLPGGDVALKNKGLAGLYGGVHNGVVLLAGGTNFPGAMPWEGGTKKYYNHIYLLTKESDKYNCKLLPDELPIAMAYGASISTGKGVICIGGENENGILRNVLLLQWDSINQKIAIITLPDLPVALTNLAASMIDNDIYVVGGENEDTVSSAVFSIRLDATRPAWKACAALPLQISHAVAVTQSDKKEKCLYVIGGRTRTASGISVLHGTVFCYHPSSNAWTEMPAMPKYEGISFLSAATGVSFGDHEIVIAGGDNGKIFSRIEQLNVAIKKATDHRVKQQLLEEKLVLLQHHEGFSKDVRLYNTVTGKWRLLEPLPYAPVTTIATKWNDSIFIAGGEIHPGIRTADIVMGTPVFSE
ncbi:MAG: hypothetical protein KGO81_13020 [Bacteroidota bacterium]|nr:hypothetical protein [Bacteroidota bacterium]